MKTKIFKFATTLLCGMFALASCEQKIDPVLPVFPTFEETTVFVEAGSATTLEFEANLDGVLSVTGDAPQWFWLDRDGDHLENLPVNAGKNSFTIVASEVEEFDSNRVCEVSLTMGGKTQKIITYVRAAKNRTVALYTAKVEDGEWVYEGGDYTYDYNSTASESLTMMLPKEQEDFSVQVKLEANFDWTLDLPERLSATNLTNLTDKAGVYEIRLAAIPSKLPLDGATDKLVVKAGDAVVKEYDVTIPACKDIVVSKLAETYQVTAEGMYENPLAGMEMPMINSSIFAAEGLSVIAVEQRGEYYYAGADDVSWVSIELGEREIGADAGVLQSQSVSLTFAPNETDNSRTAYIMALPKSLAGPDFDPTMTPFNSEGNAIKEEYQACIVSTITQAVEEEPFLSVAGGALVEKTDAESDIFMFLNSEFSTNEIYTITTNQKKFKINTAEGFYSIKLYNFTALGLVPGEPFSGSMWLDINEISSDTQLEINSWPENDVEKGVVVFYGEQENLPLAVAYIVYDVNAEGIPAPAAPFAFAYPDYVSGATLEPANAMNGGFWALETGIPLENIYILTYTSPTPNTAVINGPAVAFPPFVWYENASLTIEYMGETQFMVYNSIPVGEDDAFCFTGTDYMTKYLLICKNLY